MDRRRILIVEGNAELRTVLSDALRGLGHEVVTASDRAEAVAREDLEDFDLIISDLAEYADSATQIVSELKRKRLFVPIVVSSEEAQHDGIVKAFKLGAANYLRKPNAPADRSFREARFPSEAGGGGFDVAEIPDPRAPANLFKSSGRGVLLIYNIMDEVEYNDRGNRLTMVKRPEASLEHDLIETLTPPDDASAEKS